MCGWWWWWWWITYDADDGGGHADLFGAEAEASGEAEEVVGVVGCARRREEEEDEGVEGADVECHEVMADQRQCDVLGEY